MQDVNLPPRLSTNDLCMLWKLTKARIGQLAKAGRITKGEDGLFDRNECLAFRANQLSKQETNMLFQSYGNRGAYGLPPKVLQHMSDEERDNDILFGEPDTPPVPQSKGMYEQAMQRNDRLTEMKMSEMTIRVQRAEQRAQREAGELISRAEVYRDMHAASATIQRLLRTLEHEIPVIFADREIRPQVRQKVVDTIDRCIHSMARKIAKYESANVSSPEPEND